MKRNYPKTTGWYVYKHIFPNDMYYPGMSSQQPYNRWQPSTYKTTSLQPYIEEFGWENVEHVIVADGLTKEEAEQLENQLIQDGKKDGMCINKQGSGGYCRDNPTEYKREWQHTEKWKAYQREYQRNRYQNDPEYREKIKEYQRKYRAKKKQQC